MTKKDTAICFGLILFLGLLVQSIVWFATTRPLSNMKSAYRSYHRAAEFCGVENVDEHDYTNGSKDFDCKDYAKVSPQ